MLLPVKDGIHPGEKRAGIEVRNRRVYLVGMTTSKVLVE